MNRYCYKTIYSKTLQRIIVVAEHARGEGKAGRGNITTHPVADRCCALRQLSWRIALATGSLLILPLAQAQIVADPQAPREHQPQVLLSTEQLPQVDIQTPSAAGVSVNEYRQFDVGQEGALLNNSRKGAPTHTGGWVSGNPNLIKGEAQVIVNQVNSSNPSQLRGQIEVAGQKADVILANPAGISVNGSGFINAGKTWLTTGSPQLENGTFNGVNVERGTVHIGERGLDVRNTDYAAIIAKASKIDGPVQAGDRPLDVITGSNHVASDGKISGKGGSSTGSANTAIDTGQLGGMYGSSIRLISTDQGVGVNHAGAVQAQQLQISADGKLINRGSIDSDQLELDAHSLDNHGRISQGSGTLQVSAKTLDNAGSIRRNHVPENPKAQTGNDTAGTKTTAKSRGKDGHIRLKEGLDNRGQISSGSELHLQVAENLNNRGQLDVGALQVKDGETHNSGRIQAETASIRGNKLDNSGHFSASKHIDAATHEMDNSGVLMAPSLYLRGDNLNNSGQIIGTGSGSMQIWTADWNNYGHVGNSAGGSAPDNSDTDGAQNKTATRKQTGGSSAATTSSSDNSAGSSSLNFSHITNSGSISQSGGVDLNAAGTFTNRGDMTLKSLNYQGETLDNREGKIRSQTASVQATTLDNESGLFAAEHITRLDIQKLNNKNGVFYSGDDLRFSVAHFENPAGSTIGSGKTLSVKSPIIDNDGRLFANNVLELEAQRLNNRGNLQGGALAIDTVELNNPGTIEQTGRGILTVKAKNLHNQKDGIIGTAPAEKDKTTATDSHDAGAALAAKAGSAPAGGSGTSAPGHIAVNGKLDNSGRISAAGGIRLETGEQFRNDGHIQVAELHSELGTLDNHGHLQAQSAWLQGSQLNNYGALIADRFAKFQYSGSVNNQGQIFGRADYRIDTPRLINGQDAKILGAGRLEIADSQIDNRGELRASTLVISGDGKLVNSGNVTGENTLQLSQKSTDNQADGLLFGGQVIADGDTLYNHGRILAKQNLRFEMNTAVNHGSIEAASAFLRGNRLNNYGTLTADRIETFHYRDYISNDGQILGRSGYRIESPRINNGRNGKITSTGRLELNSSQTGNQGELRAPQLAINGGTLANSGKIIGDNALHITTARTDNQSGGLLYGGNIHLDSPQLDNHGQILTGGRLRLNAPELNNHGILLGGVLAIDSKTLNNHGSILQLGLGKLNIKTARLRNDHGAKILDNLGKPDGATTSTLQMPVSSASHEDGYINVSGKLSNYGKLLAMGAINLEVSDEYEKATTGTVNVNEITAPPPKIIPLPTPTYSSSSYGYGGTPWRSPYKNYDDDHGGKYSSMEPQESNYRPPAPKPPKAADLEAEAINRKYTSMEPQERNKPQNTVASAVQLNRGDGVNKSFNDMRLPPYTGPFGWEESFGGGGPSHEMQQLASREIAAYQSGEKKIMTEEELKEELRRISLPPSKFERTTNFIGNVWHETVEFVNPYTPFIELYQSVKAGDVKEAVIATASIIPPVGKLKKSKKFYKIVEKGEDAVSKATSKVSGEIVENVGKKTEKKVKNKFESQKRIEEAATKRKELNNDLGQSLKQKNISNNDGYGSDFPYNPREIRNYFENKYGANNVKSNTIPPLNAKNAKLAGQRHPESGVPFDYRGLPIFEKNSIFNTRLDPADLNRSQGFQKRKVVKEFQGSLEKGPGNYVLSHETRNSISKGQWPSGYTLHHEGGTKVQMIETAPHRNTGHIGKALNNGK